MTKPAREEIIKQLHREGLALSSLGKHKEAITKFEEIIKIDPRRNYAWHRKGIELNSLEKYKDALECFEKAIIIDRNDRFAWCHRGVSLRELEKHDEALRSCNEAIRINNKYPFGWYTKGSILQHLGDMAGAKECFERVVKFVPDNDMYKKRLAGIKELIQQSEIGEKTAEQWHSEGFNYWRMGENEKAILYFDKAIEINQQDHVAWHRKGISLNALKRFDEALCCFDKAIQINSNDQYAWNYRGEAFRELGKYEDALTSFNEAIKTNENYPLAWYNKGAILQRLGDESEARTCLERALQLAPDTPWWDGGTVVNEGLYTKALSGIETLEKQEERAKTVNWITDQKWRDIKYQDLPEWVKRRVKELDNHTFTGKSFEYRREPVTGSYQRRLRHAPNANEIHTKGLTYQKLGEHEQAINSFEEAIKINEMDHTAWHRKGISLNALERYAEAIECFEKAVHINSRDKFAWNHRGLSLCKMGNYRDAITSCNEAIKIDDTYRFAWCNRAVIAAYLADFKDFEYCYQKARRLDPQGLFNQFFAENLPDPPEKIPDKKGDIKLFVYYCCDLCMVHIRMKEMSETMKYVMDLRNYANEKTREILTPLIEELEFRINGGIAVTEDLIERADRILHQVKMGW